MYCTCAAHMWPKALRGRSYQICLGQVLQGNSYWLVAQTQARAPYCYNMCTTHSPQPPSIPQVSSAIELSSHATPGLKIKFRQGQALWRTRERRRRGGREERARCHSLTSQTPFFAEVGLGCEIRNPCGDIWVDQHRGTPSQLPKVLDNLLARVVKLSHLSITETTKAQYDHLVWLLSQNFPG